MINALRLKFTFYSIDREKTTKDYDRIHRITFYDRLRFIECLCSDEIKEVYMSFNETLDRLQMETRNHSGGLPAFHEKMVTLFNNVNYKLHSTAYPGLHSDFHNQILLEKGEYNITVDKCKYLLGEAKPLLVEMIER